MNEATVIANKCRCGTTYDASVTALHALSCPLNKGIRTRRRHFIVKILAALITKTKIGPATTETVAGTIIANKNLIADIIPTLPEEAPHTSLTLQ